jgi:hypothetical protein
LIAPRSIQTSPFRTYFGVNASPSASPQWLPTLIEVTPAKVESCDGTLKWILSFGERGLQLKGKQRVTGEHRGGRAKRGL